METKLGYVGSLCLICIPYALNTGYSPLFGVLGLALITPQCWKAKQWNLVGLNAVSFIGYLIKLMETL